MGCGSSVAVSTATVPVHGIVESDGLECGPEDTPALIPEGDNSRPNSLATTGAADVPLEKPVDEHTSTLPVPEDAPAAIAFIEDDSSVNAPAATVSRSTSNAHQSSSDPERTPSVVVASSPKRRAGRGPKRFAVDSDTGKVGTEVAHSFSKGCSDNCSH